MTSSERQFSTIGVIGLGTMGAGIAEVFARNGYTVTGVELTDEAVARGREHLEHSTSRAVKRGKMSEAEQKELLDRITLHDLDGRPAQARLRRRGRRGVAGDQEEHLPRRSTTSSRPTRSWPPTPRRCRSPRSRPRTAAPAGSSACTSSTRRRCRTSSRSIRTVVTEPDVARGRQGAGRPAGQEPRGLRRQGRLHRQHAAVRLPQPRGVDVRGPLRHPRGHRRGDALRLRLPDGPAGAARPDRPRHGVRDPRHDVQAGPRPAARARPILKQMVTAGPARPQDRPRLLHLRGARQPDRGRRRQDARRSRRQAAAAPRHPAGRRGRLRHDGHRHRRGASPRPATTSRTSAAAPTKVDGVARPPSSARSRRRSSAASSRRPTATRRSAASPAPPTLDDLADVDIVVEAIAEDLAVKKALFENLDEICTPGAILATTTSSLPIIALASVTDRPQDVIGMHFFNPAQVMKLVEVVSRCPPTTTWRRPSARCARRRQGRRSRAATGPASSSTRCCSPTSTTRSGCSRRTTRPPTTSTPR